MSCHSRVDVAWISLHPRRAGEDDQPQVMTATARPGSKALLFITASFVRQISFRFHIRWPCRNRRAAMSFMAGEQSASA